MQHYTEINRNSTSTFSGTGCHLICEWWKTKGSDKCGQNDFNNFFITINAKLNFQQIQKADASQF